MGFLGCFLSWRAASCFVMRDIWPNKADAQNPAMMSLFQIGRHGSRVCDLRRWLLFDNGKVRDTTLTSMRTQKLLLPLLMMLCALSLEATALSQTTNPPPTQTAQPASAVPFTKWWLLVPSTLGGLITGSFAVGATWLTYWHNRRLTRTQQQKRINGLLSAIRNEVEIAHDIYRRKAGNALEALPDGKPFYNYISVTESFFIVYPNNTEMVGQIADRELCKAIIETYNTANYVIEGLRVNNWYLDRVSKWRERAEASAHARMSIPEVEKRLVDYASGLKKGNIVLKQQIDKLIVRIDNYLRSHQV